MESTGEEDAAPRPSIEKQRPQLPAIDRLPDEIIEQILQFADPDSFASLVHLNSNWRRVSQQAHLYSLHLEACPSYAASHKLPTAPADDQLPQLRKAFAREVKRNLFEAYLRPTETVIRLVSNSISSSSCPGGEGLQFAPSPKGHHLLAYSSSRIYVIDVRQPDIDVKRELKILRRPVSICTNDEGTVLAVLSTEMQVDVYDLTQTPPQRTQSMLLDHAPRTIALSPCGSVLAAAYEGGIEVSSMNPHALSTERRSVKCDAVDSLAFSFDGTQLLGTTVHASSPNTVVLTAPYYDPGSMADDNISSLWTTSILFPNTSRDCSHAVLLQDTGQEEASWTFTYDRSFETFRAVRIDDLRNGTTYFTGPIPSPSEQVKLLPCTLPTATYHGDLVSAGFQGKDIWLYGVPEDLDAVPELGPGSGPDGLAALGRRNSGPPSRTPSSRAQDGSTRPRWQILCDKLRNTFVWGAKVAELDGVSNVKWVAGFGGRSTKERLVIAARGIMPAKPINEPDDIDFVDGGRITLLDFDYGTADGVTREITIEVGTKEPEVLEEETRDIDAEVAIVRRRTVAQKRGERGMMRTATVAASRSSPVPPMPSLPPLPREEHEEDGDDDPLLPRRIGTAQARSATQPAAPADDSAGDHEEGEVEAQEAVDAPYSHDNPRSTTTLRRAATAAAINRRRQPETPAAGPVEYRRADGRREHPHESDADNWVPPPPPYQKDAPVDLPAFLRHPAVGPTEHKAKPQPQPPRTQTAAPTVGGSAWPLPDSGPPSLPMHVRGYQEPPAGPQHTLLASSHHRRITSDSSASIRAREAAVARPATSALVHRPGDEDNLYDVSPPDSPRLGASSSSRQVSGSTGLTSPQPPQPTQQPLHGDDRGNLMPSRPGMGGLAIPDNTQLSNLGLEPPPGRRLSNAQTWPTVPTSPPVPLGDYPLSAPPSGASANEMIAAAMAYQYQDPRMSLGSRGSQPSNHRSSLQRVPVGSRQAADSRTSVHQHMPQPGMNRAATSPREDVPLIISTPGGVSGAFDPPPHPGAGPRTETPILAPIPRHPRPTQSNLVRPAVERIDPSFNQPPESSTRGFMRSLLSAPSTTSIGRRSHSSITRKPSRAERSAAKNMLDAKRNGWGGSKKGKKKKKKKPIDYEVASSAAWTDVSAISRPTPPTKADKKCILM
ncbi:F-box domain-containing protein [Plectosphaerella cucumerina]|uniref:F-box domain-containing protein n=1 Tax=Plectosphaerella cucumerina TaxID=40658 RepID=A0A8K0TT94_9PEZI|nr:F-box domain-containing protein [Plectosphaerella cucumerina]